MPSVTPVQNPTTWLSILTRLGIPQFGRWFLSDTVQPVALVDSSITLNAVTLPTLWGTPASAGESVAPVANTRLADTGQLAAGNWTILAWMSHNDAGGNGFRLRRRNAADAADVWSFRFAVSGASGLAQVVQQRFTVALNERFVVENTGNGAGGSTYQAAIFALQT